MADVRDEARLDLPRVYVVRMLVFTLVVGILAAVLYPNIQKAFLANVGLNGVIIGVLVLGILYCFRMALRLWPEIKWVNAFRTLGPTGEVSRAPVLLAPMATQLGARAQGTTLSPTSMRALLDSIASRLDESRDISRYLVGLLIFLGLLGTFWGLLDTVSSIGDAIKALDVGSGQSATVFEELKAGLARPLAGMGLSFSSSLFGLAGSLIMGFLDLQASQAQNRFYNDLENWLSTFTDLEAGEGGAQMVVPPVIKMDLQGLQKGMDKIGKTLDAALASNDVGVGGDTESLDKLADAVASIVEQMREEQKMLRQWVQSQQLQQNEIQRLLLKAQGTAPNAAQRLQQRMRVEDEE
jgi:membrane associated rhomboid family serine protease